jgi:hypothetical protein
MLASVFGVVGLAAIKIAPLYVDNLRVRAVLADLKEEADGQGMTEGNLRLSLSNRLYIEGVTLRPGSLKITPVGSNYNVSVKFDNRTEFLADIWFLIVVDEQIEIRR